MRYTMNADDKCTLLELVGKDELKEYIILHYDPVSKISHFIAANNHSISFPTPLNT
jgi:hypothetical protein